MLRVAGGRAPTVPTAPTPAQQETATTYKQNQTDPTNLGKRPIETPLYPATIFPLLTLRGGYFQERNPTVEPDWMSGH